MLTEFPSRKWKKLALYRLIEKLTSFKTRHHLLFGRDHPCKNLWTRLPINGRQCGGSYSSTGSVTDPAFWRRGGNIVEIQVKAANTL